LYYKDYIDKIIQLSILVPRFPESQIAEFIKGVSADKDIQQCASIFAAGLPPNPRKIKRVMRAFLFVRDFIARDPKNSDIKSFLLAKLVVIQSQFPEMFEAIIESPTLLQKIEKYYHPQDGSEVQPSSTAEMKEEDKRLHEQITKYAADHPELGEILLTHIDKSDTFINIDMSRYITLLGALAVVRPLPEETSYGGDGITIDVTKRGRVILSRDPGCAFFVMKQVEYSDPEWKLTSNPNQITFLIQGRRSAGHTIVHNCKIELRDLRTYPSIEFSPPGSNLEFSTGSTSVTFMADTSQSITQSFFLKKVEVPNAEIGRKLVITCSFGHGFPDSWHEHQQVIQLETA
jgi:hypothetical protein